MSLYEYKTNIRYGVIDTKNNGKVSAWNEKQEIKAKVNIVAIIKLLIYSPLLK